MRPVSLVSTLAIATLLVAACGGDDDNGATTNGSGQDGSGSCEDISLDEPLTIGFASATQPAYAPALLTIETSENVPMEPVLFQQSELAMQAILQGEVDVLAIGVNGPMITISEGAELRIFGVTIGNDWTVVATQDVQAPEDLEGTTIAIHSETSTGTPLVRGTLDEVGANADFITVPGSPSRAQAMLQGQADATTLFLSDSIRLELDDPDRFHLLLDYTDVPFASQSLVAGTDWLNDDPLLVECVVTQFVETGQRISDDSAWATDELVSMFPDEDPQYLETLVNEYVGHNLWVSDGGQELLGSFGEALEMSIDLGTLQEGASTDPAEYLQMEPLDAALERAGQ